MRNAWIVLAAGLLAQGAGAERIHGMVRDAAGHALAGVAVTVESGAPLHRLSVFTDDAGAFATPPLPPGGPYRVQARRIGWHDTTQDAVSAGAPLELVLERHTEPDAVAAQLPAHHWWQLVVERFETEALRHRLKRECTFCHQQGSEWTRRPRPTEEWQKLIVLMERRGARLPEALHTGLADALAAAYEPAHAVPRLTAGWEDAERFAPAPSPAARRAVVEEWDLGSRASMQHDVVVHPDGRIYSVDGSQDQLHRLDPTTGERDAWDVPQENVPLGGIFGETRGPVSQTAVSRVGPHSLQVAPDGSLWLTLAIGNLLAHFDPETERFTIHPVAEGYYPHTLRFDPRGRIWYTMAASNHVGMFDPATDEQRHVRLPARTWAQAAVLRLMPVMLWLDQQVDLRSRTSGAGSGNGFTMPVPYGIDIAPDGGVWFSQLNENRIGRIDPDSLAVTLFETPFPAPRRLRFDGRGTLWIPSFSAGSIAAYDPAADRYREYELPIRPLAGETPYALAVNPLTDDVWVCGTNSDTLIRFEPDAERFTVYPLPTRVTYTREIDFDAEGRVWTSNSNSPAWQIEGGQPRVLRLDPDPARTAARAAAAGVDRASLE
ncbi:MAG: carboxypeptidase regulatory-like domain-containing protein [Myxococcota bacterium]